MNRKIINIINVNIDLHNNIKIECIYKHAKNINPVILLKNHKRDKMKLICNTVDFSNELDITQINICLKAIGQEKIEIKIKENKAEYNVIFLDNKNEEICSESNEYVVFLKKYKLEIFKEKIELKERKIFDKIKYEIKKINYSIKKYKKIYFIRLLANTKKKYYLFNDRIMYADDNAEQLFEYINSVDNKMAKRSYFVLDRKSPKIKEIRKYGKILKYGSLKHKIKYLNSRMIISSHASYFDRVYNPFNDEEMDVIRDLIAKKFVFVQHGVVYNDLHTMLNRPQIIADLFITTTNREYKEILSDKYMYEKEMVVCTGLPRFDRLNDIEDKVILIAPTWRTYLTDVEYGDTNKQGFEESMFYKEYQALLKDDILLEKLAKSGYRIKFLLHPAFLRYKNIFKKFNNEFVKVLTTDEISYSELFKECSIFITDYSSTHFDVAFLKKPIIYYQFDKEEFYKSHYEKGYFDYKKDGFGDVTYNKEQIVKQIIAYIDNKCHTKETYINRIEKTFKYLDKNNSKRIYEKILELDKKEEVDYRFNKVH